MGDMSRTSVVTTTSSDCESLQHKKLSPDQGAVVTILVSESSGESRDVPVKQPPAMPVPIINVVESDDLPSTAVHVTYKNDVANVSSKVSVASTESYIPQRYRLSAQEEYFPLLSWSTYSQDQGKRGSQRLEDHVSMDRSRTSMTAGLPVPWSGTALDHHDHDVHDTTSLAAHAYPMRHRASSKTSWSRFLVPGASVLDIMSATQHHGESEDNFRISGCQNESGETRPSGVSIMPNQASKKRFVGKLRGGLASRCARFCQTCCVRADRKPPSAPQPDIPPPTSDTDRHSGAEHIHEREEHVTRIGFGQEACPEDFFDFLGTLGQGSYGQVHLARQRDTGDMFAVKVQLKQHRKKANIEVIVMTLPNLPPFLITLHSSFATQTALYMVLELVTGGCLSQKLIRPFNLPAVVFCSAQIALALMFLHSNHIIYRDLKPDNVLFTEDGNIKLCDFGSCFLNAVGNKKAKVSTGTPRYWAPEKFRQEPHGRPSDWWCLGIILYEMLMAKFPFRSTGREWDAYMSAVLHKTEVYEKSLHPDAVSACKGFLTKHPDLRLGGPQEQRNLMEHPLYKDVDWDAITNFQIQPPPLYASSPNTPRRTFESSFGTGRLSAR